MNLNKFKFLYFLKENSYFLLFVFSTIFTYSLSNLFYLSTRSPDFERYSKYLDYFNGDVLYTDLEQGLIYYFIVHFFISLQFNKVVFEDLEFYFNFNNFDHLISIGIQTANHLLFFIGCLGLYYFFKELNFEPKYILLVMSFINIVPDSIKLKLSMKPEIMGFALLSWMLYFMEKYKKTNKNVFVCYSILIFTILATLKGSIFAMTSIVVIVMYFNLIKSIGIKKIISFVLFFIITATPIFFENYQINQRSIFERSDLLKEYDQENYDNRADIQFLYSFNLIEYLKNPVADSQAGSALGITSNEMFGDYFNLYWNLDYSLFKQDTKVFIKTSNKSYIDSFNDIIYINFIDNLNFIYLKLYLSFFISIIFISLLIYNFVKSLDKNKFLFLLPFVGILILLLNSFGIPENNFDPLVGDTLKPFYYSFLTIISFAYISIKYLHSNFKTTILVFVLLTILFMFIYGFPKENNTKLDYDLKEHNAKTIFCQFNKIYLKTALIENKDINCLNGSEKKCLDFYYLRNENLEEAQLPSIELRKNSEYIQVSNFLECESAVKNNFSLTNKHYEVNNIPFFNFSYFLLFLLIIVLDKLGIEIFRKKINLPNS